MNMNKQLTYLVVAKNDEEKLLFAQSSLCMVRDWNMGWFDVPANMRSEFFEMFGVSGPEHSACRLDITKKDIEHYNRSKIPFNFEKNSLDDFIQKSSNPTTPSLNKPSLNTQIQSAEMKSSTVERDLVSRLEFTSPEH